MTSNIADLKSVLHKYPNFPVKGVLFEDFLPIFRDHRLFKKLINCFKNHSDEQFKDIKIDYIVGIEARGFLFGPSLALAMNSGFVPIRKQGKLPGECFAVEYEKEYGTDIFEIQKGSIPIGANVIILDDIIATGGTALAAFKLMEEMKVTVLEFDFVMELDFLKGRKQLDAPVFTLLKEQEQALATKN
ncbi:adenine phosphoribosyltransferase [Maudiozyma exigua]|uniref:adenine phosphoribosyltransferase n=1 Tax=Maudiozyma exigua TaxID=34358 RepID=A0A9P7BB85_MAUEX|nr:adenine phosphoribosyltransferase [Kazachstania exigua]